VILYYIIFGGFALLALVKARELLRLHKLTTKKPHVVKGYRYRCPICEKGLTTPTPTKYIVFSFDCNHEVRVEFEDILKWWREKHEEGGSRFLHE